MTQRMKYASGDTLLARTKYEYDAAGRQTVSRRKASPGGADSNSTDYVVTSYYGDDGQLTKRTGASGNDTTYAYDKYGSQSKTTLPDNSYTSSSHDANGRVSSRTRYEIVGGNTHSLRHDYTLDALGRAVSTTNQGPDGTFGNGDDLTVIYVYDGAGRRVSTTDEGGRIAVAEYDMQGRKSKSTEDSAGIARVTEFSFDRAARLVTLSAYTDSPSTGQQDTIYAYNGRGLQTIVTYEETGDLSKFYDAAGNMVSRTDEESVQVDYEYDALNQLSRRLKNGSTSDVEKYTYDGLGRLSVARKGTTANDDAVSQNSFTYDSLSRVVTESQAIAEGSAKNVIYTYDKGSNRISMNGSSGVPSSAYAYDSRDRCSGIDQHNGSAWVDLADYTWLGGAISKRETICDYVGNTQPKFKTAFQRDGILRVTQVLNEHLTEDQAGSTYGSLGAFDYGYDSSSNVLSTLQTATMDELDADRCFMKTSQARVVRASRLYAA